MRSEPVLLIVGIKDLTARRCLCRISFLILLSGTLSYQPSRLKLSDNCASPLRSILRVRSSTSSPTRHISSFGSAKRRHHASLSPLFSDNGAMSTWEADDRRQNKERRALIQQMLDEDEVIWQEEQRQRKLDEEQTRIDQLEESQRMMAELAQNVGVTFTTVPSANGKNQLKKLEPLSITTDINNASPISGSTNYRALTNGEGAINGSYDKKNTYSSNEYIERSKKNVQKLENFKKKKEQERNIDDSSNGGTFVGSAGGWTLEIFPGDFVVHRKYGIGRYERTVVVDKIVELGTEEHYNQQRRREALVKAAKNAKWSATKIEKLVNAFGTSRDNDLVSRPRATMLELSYQDGLVQVPIDKAYRLSRYRAGDAAVKPKLSRIRGDHTWRKAKERVAQSTTELAQDVLALYATRETLTRHPYSPQMEYRVKAFGDSFPYTPTPDQYKCFEDIENDMVWRRRPMDRLVCGDVGFGKTEVAMRALYRCVENGRQAVLLAPTGVLASQHYKNLLQRLGPNTPFNVNVGFLRGGMTHSKAGKILRDQIESGEIQIVVGTHALLSKGVPYNNLGLLVVDEEQRFGVKQKERLKVITDGVDVLTLSATPIPRTLQMSLSGIRDTSTIKSPPPMRKPIVSVIEPYSDSLVHEAISRELRRGGQVFYVVPRISMIESSKAAIQSLFPETRIIVAHGRQGPGVAEANVEEFAQGNYDVLLATTVIENGVDIPSVNTIVVQNSQAYGMSTLYQLRGRVGRSNIQAYAYFLHEEASLTEQAVARLQAMAELHALGSGFDVATRDLEIRGAGSLLGTEQSGMAERVGFDLYMRMLKKSIRQLKVLDLPSVPRTNIFLPKNEGGIESNDSYFTIPPSYISNSTKRIQAESAARLAENTNQLVQLTKEWKDVYGPLPLALKKQMKTLHLHACTRTLGVDMVGLVGDDLVLRSPGLRPRHWATICNSFPKQITPKHVNAIFPGRFSPNSRQVIVEGGTKLEERLQRLGQQSDNPKDQAKAVLSSLTDEEDEEWDDFDEEEVEALKQISSSLNVKDFDLLDIEHYPRLVVPDFGTNTSQGQRVDRLLKILLPVVNAIVKKQKEDKDRAKIAMDLRDRRETLKKAKKEAAKRVEFAVDFSSDE